MSQKWKRMQMFHSNLSFQYDGLFLSNFQFFFFVLQEFLARQTLGLQASQISASLFVAIQSVLKTLSKSFDLFALLLDLCNR
jgi:hypothetical protein